MKSLFTLPFLLLTIASMAQINKGQFLVGGSGTYSAITYRDSDTKFRAFEIDGRGGNFLLNKMAAGIQLGYNYNKQFGIDDNTNQYYRQTERSISAGPFVRYYLFPATNKVNFLADASYFRSWSRSGNLYGGGKWKSYGYALAAGPAFFLNPNVSLETTLNYEYNHKLYTPKIIRVKAGFQVHLNRKRPQK